MKISPRFWLVFGWNGGVGGALPDVEVLPHLLAPVAHDGLVLADAQLLAVHQARALGPRLVLVVWVLLQVLLAQPGLLLVVWLLL